MKEYNRKIYILPSLNDSLKERLAHIDNGIAGDELIPDDKSFDVSFNRDAIKKINRFREFLRISEPDEISSFFKERNEIEALDKIYSGLKSYKPDGSYFKIIFFESKGLLREAEYKFLYLLPLNKSLDDFDIKGDLAKTVEWKKEYVLTDTQKRISTYSGYNVVLGAAGTGKTDVAIHAYIEGAPVNNIKSFGIRDNVFITYSKKLSDYVTYITDIYWNDYKNPIRKNVYTTKDFLINVLASNNTEIDGYTLKDSKYVKNGVSKPKDLDYLENNISDFNTFKDWYRNGCLNMNKAFIPALNDIIKKYGDDYPYLFYRGIYKGKIINKVSDEEISLHFTESLKISDKEFEAIKTLLNNYVENADDLGSEYDFKNWYNTAVRRYSLDFKNMPSRFREEPELYELFLNYFDFVNPIRESKRYIDYYILFKREALLTEGYRGNTRKDFDDEVKVLYDMCEAFQKYMEDNKLYDDNDLAYLVSLNMDDILEKGIFKNIIADEFQDMTERQVHTIVRLTYNDMNHGAAHIFGDFEQTINPTFLQMENVETIYLVNDINNYETQTLSSSFRYSSAICRELEALREMGKKLFGTEDLKGYLPLVSNADKEFETGGNLLLDLKLGKEMLAKISKAKNGNIMYIVSDEEAKEELINEFKAPAEKIFTISESKGREEDFVIVYKLVTNKAHEYENLFSDDMEYSRAGRIFYNQLYVGITRCKTNFLEIEDETKLGEKTKEALVSLITPLIPENVNLFLEELISAKANFYFRARDSFKKLDFKAASDNMAFYSGEDFDNLRETLSIIDKHLNGEKKASDLALIANSYKAKKRYDLARVIYIVLDNNDMGIMLDIRENINTDKYTDSDIRRIIMNNKEFLDNSDIEAINNLGYYKRKEDTLSKKIASIKGRMVK